VQEVVIIGGSDVRKWWYYSIYRRVIRRKVVGSAESRGKRGETLETSRTNRKQVTKEEDGLFLPGWDTCMLHTMQFKWPCQLPKFSLSPHKLPQAQD
jgi:hypothetical protein